jgi:hypothetical protein
MKNVFLSVTLLSVFSTIGAVAGPIGSPVQWNGSGGNNHFYQAVQQTGVTWEEAMAGAQAMGGYLATIGSAEENAFIFPLVDFPELWVIHESGSWLGPRLGGVDSGCTNHWEWHNGEPWNYTNWYFEEPNLIGLEDSLEFFAGGHAVSRTAAWNNVTKDYLLAGYVVEWDTRSNLQISSPEPATLLLFGPAIALMAYRRRRAS